MSVMTLPGAFVRALPIRCNVYKINSGSNRCLIIFSTFRMHILIISPVLPNFFHAPSSNQWEIIKYRTIKSTTRKFYRIEDPRNVASKIFFDEVKINFQSTNFGLLTRKFFSKHPKNCQKLSIKSKLSSQEASKRFN